MFMNQCVTNHHVCFSSFFQLFINLTQASWYLIVHWAPLAWKKLFLKIRVRFKRLKLRIHVQKDDFCLFIYFFCSEYSSVAYQKMHKEETNAMTYLCFSLIKEFPWYSTKHNFSILSYSTFKQKLSMFFISLAFSVIGVLNFVVYEVIAFIHNCVVDRNDLKIIGEWCYIKI